MIANEKTVHQIPKNNSIIDCIGKCKSSTIRKLETISIIKTIKGA